jgi:hypothetical protein
LPGKARRRRRCLGATVARLARCLLRYQLSFAAAPAAAAATTAALRSIIGERPQRLQSHVDLRRLGSRDVHDSSILWPFGGWWLLPPPLLLLLLLLLLWLGRRDLGTRCADHPRAVTVFTRRLLR